MACRPIPPACWTADEWSAAAAVVAAIAAIYALVYARSQIEGARLRARQQLMREFMGRWESEAIIRARQLVNSNSRTPEAFELFWEEANETDSDAYYQLVTLGNYFEDMAIRVQEDLLDKDEVIRTMGNSIGHYLSIYRPLVSEESGEIYSEWNRVFGFLCEEEEQASEVKAEAIDDA